MKIEKAKREQKWKERRKRMIEKGKEKKAETEMRNRDRKGRLKKKSELESKWEMLRWVINFIDNNKDRWEKERKEREKVEMETIRMWEKKTREEKIDQIVTEKIKETPSEESLWRKIRMKSAGGRGGDKQEVTRLSVAVYMACYTFEILLRTNFASHQFDAILFALNIEFAFKLTEFVNPGI